MFATLILFALPAALVLGLSYIFTSKSRGDVRWLAGIIAGVLLAVIWNETSSTLLF